MKNLIHISIFVIFPLVNVLPLCTAEPATIVTIGLISSVMGIISFFQSNIPNDTNPTVRDNYLQWMHTIDEIKIGERLSSIEHELERMYEIIPKQTNYVNQVSDLHLHINEIDLNYKAMLKKVQKMANGTQFNPIDESIAGENVVDYLGTKSSLLRTISNIHSNFVSHGSPTSQYIKDNVQLTRTASCSEASQLQSNQQGLQKLFASIVISQVKVLLTAQMAADYLNKTRGNYPAESLEEVYEPVGTQYRETINVLKKLMLLAPRDVWVCDPQPHVENTTFIQLVNVFQRQIVDIMNFENQRILFDQNQDHAVKLFGKNVQSKVWWWGEVPDNTDAYYDVVQKDILWMEHVGAVFKYNHVCQGYVWDCEMLSELFSTNYMKDAYLICHSLPDSSRRFDRIEAHSYLGERSEILDVFGTKKPCDFKRHKKNYVMDSYVCTCDETSEQEVEPTMVRSHYSYRFFSTEGVKVTLPNYVVTGVKLGQYRGIIYPIIQQGRLLREGVVDRDSLEWIDMANHPNHSLSVLTDQRNLIRIHWEYRTIKLGDVDLPPNTLLTGLSFIKTEWEKGIDGPLRLALIYREFDFKTGIVKSRTTVFEQYKDDYGRNASDTFDYTYSPMVEIDNLPLPDLNLRSTVIESDKYLNFTTSDFKTDLGQTTIPYLDMQNVTTAVPAPIGGAGLYYKYTPGHTGYIGIKLKTYDISQHIPEPTEILPESVKEALQTKISFQDGSLGIFKDDI